MFLALIIGIPVGVIASLFKRSIVNKFSTYYGLLAGSLPDFWLGLIFIYFFYTVLGWAAAPMGRLDLGVLPPDGVTGSFFLDSIFHQWISGTPGTIHDGRPSVLDDPKAILIKEHYHWMKNQYTFRPRYVLWGKHTRNFIYFN